MQKIFIAVVLALALCSATAKYTVETAAWAKAPVPVCEGANAIDCTNATTLMMIGLSFPDVSVWAYGTTGDASNSSATSWKAFTAKINTKDLSTPANSSMSFTAPKTTQFRYGYALQLVSEKTDNITNLFFYQTKLDGNVPLPRIPITSNTNKDFTPLPMGYKIVGKSVVVLAVVADKKLNITSVTLGETTLSGDCTLSTSFNDTTVEFGTGDALGASRVVLSWNEGSVLKQAVYDLSKGTSTGGDVKGYNQTLHTDCRPFSTDKEYYGIFCTGTVDSKLNIYVSIINNGSDLVKLTADTADANMVVKPYPYAGFVAFILANSNFTSGDTTLYKTIWDLKTSTAELKTTKLGSSDGYAGSNLYQIPGAGAYLMLWNRNGTAPRTDIVVGLMLAGSYLTTVFGFLIAIIAGLLLF